MSSRNVTKSVMRTRQSENRQCNEKKITKRPAMICKHCTENKRSHNTNSIKPGVNSGAPKGLSVTGGLVAPVVLRIKIVFARRYSAF